MKDFKNKKQSYIKDYFFNMNPWINVMFENIC